VKVVRRGIWRERECDHNIKTCILYELIMMMMEVSVSDGPQMVITESEYDMIWCWWWR
jgi:hypothetical protein